MNNYDVSIFIITDDMQMILPEEYDINDENGEFVMVTNNELNQEYDDDNTIYISRDWLDKIQESRDKIRDSFDDNKHCFMFFDYDYNNDDYVYALWSLRDDDIPNLKYQIPTLYTGRYNLDKKCLRKQLNGYMICQDIILKYNQYIKTLPNDERLTIEHHIPATMVAYHTQVTYGNKVYNGYMPSIGQWLYISNNIIQINNALVRIKAEIIKITHTQFNSNNKWWSSSMTGDGAYYILNGEPSCANRSIFRYRVLPLFPIDR